MRGSVVLARRLGLSELFVGLTIVGFGTSMPELMVSVDAALSGAPGIALGNVIGSNITNTLLITGVAGLIAPIVIGGAGIKRDAAIGCAASLILLALVQGEVIGRAEGFGLLALLAVYLSASYWLERRNANGHACQAGPEGREVEPEARAWLAPIMVLGGIVALVAGAELLVRGSVAIAQNLGVPPAIIGLSLVAFGTSLPELATAIAAALAGRHGVVLGNIIGSNIFNILAILGATAAIAPISVSPLLSDGYSAAAVVVAFALLAVLYLAKRIGRPLAVAMIAGYGVYMAFLVSSGLAG